MAIITHLLAVMGGGIIGVAVMCLCFTASEADRKLMEDDSDDPDG